MFFNEVRAKSIWTLLSFQSSIFSSKMSLGHALKEGIFVVAAKRTPFGAFGGSLKNFSPTDLQALASAAALKAGNVNPEAIGKNLWIKYYINFLLLVKLLSKVYHWKSQCSVNQILFLSHLSVCPVWMSQKLCNYEFLVKDWRFRGQKRMKNWKKNYDWPQLWKLRKFTITLFLQKFRQINVLLKKLLLKCWFDEIFFGESEFLVFPHCVLCCVPLSFNFDEKFVKLIHATYVHNYFAASLKMFSRKNSWNRVILSSCMLVPRKFRDIEFCNHSLKMKEGLSLLQR